MATYAHDSSALEHCGFCYRQICGSHLLREVCEFCRKNFYESEAGGRAVHLARMSPEDRATYDRIRALREEIGPIDFDVVEALRELRGDDGGELELRAGAAEGD